MAGVLLVFSGLLFPLHGRALELAPGCSYDAAGKIVCEVADTSPPSEAPGGGSPEPDDGGSTPALPLLRYLRIVDHPAGDCWVWARYPPGLDAWDPANDAAIIAARSSLPPCPSDPSDPSAGADLPGLAWAIFREFPLAAPDPELDPDVGITGLPTRLGLSVPAAIDHTEDTPLGALVVEAAVSAVVVDWGDGSPPEALAPASAGRVTHDYDLKTCPPDYRRDHPSGGNCHPTLEAYPVSVTFVWAGRFRVGGTWVELGTLDRRTVVAYDVDEVVGIVSP